MNPYPTTVPLVVPGYLIAAGPRFRWGTDLWLLAAHRDARGRCSLSGLSPGTER